MLEKLNSIPWAKLKHAYGSASDVPKQIRGLADPHLGARGPALSELYGNIFHQGTRYQSAPFAVPFLGELLRDAATVDKHQIIYLMVSLALGYEESYLSDGLNIAKMRREWAKSIANMSAADRAECDRWGFGPKVELDCYDAVLAEVPSFLRLLSDNDQKTKKAAVYALSWFSERASESLPAVLSALSSETNEMTIANTVLAIGLLIRTSSALFQPDQIRDLLSHSSLIVSVAAAIAMARDPLQREIVDILIVAIANTEQLQGIADEIRFNEGNLAGYASLVLARYGFSARERIIPALCETL